MPRRLRFLPLFPKYFQIQSILRERIFRANSAGSKLPGEAALCREFGVSRVTLRQALAALERERLIRREKGRGTFVAPRLPRPAPKQKFTGLAEDLFDAGVATRVKLLDRAEVPASADLAARLQIPTGQDVLHVERVWYVQERPFSHAHCYLPSHVARKLVHDDLEGAPVSVLLHRRYRVPIVEAEQTIEPCLADAHTAELLDLPVGSLLLRIERIYLSRNKRPVCYVQSIYRADRYQYTVTLKRSFPRNPASGGGSSRGPS